MAGTDVRWRLSIGEESYEFSRSEWMLSEAQAVKKWTQLNPPQFWAAVGEDDPDAMAALLCVLRQRAGQDIRFSDVDCNYGGITLEPLDDDEETDGESDPPTTAPSTPRTRSGNRKPAPQS